jgi:alkylation response protein AidB-like acyl-CoA dehydrogenase
MTATAVPTAGRADERGDSLAGQPLARARALAPVIGARSAEIERARTLPPDLVARLRDAGLFRIAMPAGLGGPGVSPREMVETIEEVSRADGATGWCVLIANIGAAFLAWLDEAAAAEIAGRQPDLLIAGGQAPLGQAEQVGDAYRLTGRWAFASGCLHANWFMGGFMVMDGGRPKLNQWGVPEMRIGHFPADQARVEDTWDVAGLAGTGSHDIVAEQVLVPAAYTSVPYFAPAPAPDPLFRLTGYNLLLTLMSGFPLGVARRALAEAREQLGRRERPGAEAGWLADPAVQVTLLHHEAALAAARRHVLDTLEELLAALAEGPGSYPERARLAAAVIHAYDVGREVVQDCFRLAGAAALFDDNPLQRCLRDLVAGAQHVAFSADSRKRVANALLGRQEQPVFFGV